MDENKFPRKNQRYIKIKIILFFEFFILSCKFMIYLINTENDAKDPEKLLKEIERVKIEKGLLGNELEKTKSLLQIQQQINDDQQSMFNEEKKIFKHQIDKLTKKCDELSKLVDIERLPKNYLSVQQKNILSSRDPNLLINELIPSEKLVNLMSDAITEFSKDETETDIGLNENYLDLYIGEAIFESGIEKDLKFSLNNIMSFIAVDFYLHETQTSNLNAGIKPIYNLQMSFKVTVEENFIHYLESENINIDIYYIRDNKQDLLGKAKISLYDILESENPNSNKFANNNNNNITNLTRVINTICTIYYAKDPTIKIGSLHYKMRMRQPILEVIKWYREKNEMLREISPIHDVTLKRVEKEIVNLNNLSKGKIMCVTILITKCQNLKISGPPRKVMPYIYYQFYKFDDHYSKTGTGTDPLFQDIEKFDVVYDKNFHDYVEKESLEIMIFDDSRALEVEMRQDENKNNLVSLVDQGEFEDLIGVCKVPLHNLLVNDLIQNSFPLFNKKGQNSGEIVLNIFWETVQIDDNKRTDKLFSSQAGGRNVIPYETKAWEETLIIKLADMLKYKGFNVNSAFGILDKDCNDQITVLNFKDIILFTLKFTNSQEELERLTSVIFCGKSSISKLEFYKIFSPLLPSGAADANNNNVLLSEMLNKSGNSFNSSMNMYNTSMKINKNNQENKVVDTVSINLLSNNNFNPNYKNTNTFDRDLNISLSNNNNNNFNNLSMVSANPRDNNFATGTSDNFNKINSQSTNNFNSYNSNTNFRSASPKDFNAGGRMNINANANTKNLSLYEIIVKINEYMMKTSKNTIVEVYKMFDKDANSLVDKNVKNIFESLYFLFVFIINFTQNF